MRYSADFVAAVNNGVDTNAVLFVSSSQTLRGAITFLSISTTGAPEDVAVTWVLQRTTTAGSGALVIPERLDPGDPSGLSNNNGREALTTEPTYTAAAVVLNIGINARCAYHWWAQSKRNVIWLPTTQNAGLGLLPTHATSTVATAITMHIEE